MNPKITKALAVTVVALQIPMLALWWIVYNTAKITCYTLQITDGGGYTLVLDPSKLLCTFLIYAPLILALVACMVLSVGGLVRAFRGKLASGLATVLLYGGIVMACGLLVCVFSRTALFHAYGRFIHGLFDGGTVYHSDLLLSEYMFYRYPFGLDIRYDLMSIWPFMQSLKYILLGLQIAVGGALCIDGILKSKNKIFI